MRQYKPREHPYKPSTDAEGDLVEERTMIPSTDSLIDDNEFHSGTECESCQGNCTPDKQPSLPDNMEENVGAVSEECRDEDSEQEHSDGSLSNDVTVKIVLMKTERNEIL
jgi:hypothetical protein